LLGILQNRAYKRAIAARLDGSAPGAEVPAGGKSQQIFCRALFAMMGRLAKIDGLVTREEVAYTSSVMRKIGLKPRQQQEAIDYFELGKDMHTDVLHFVEELVPGVGRRSVLSQLFLQTLFRLVFAKGGMRLKEKLLLREVSELFGFSPAEFRDMCASFGGEQANKFNFGHHGSGASLLSNAYRVLQLEPNADDGEIRRAYLRLMSRYHPDKLVRENLSEEDMKLAQERSSDIRDAYEALCGYRKIRA
jgi:DnaJ like chaperone protein